MLLLQQYLLFIDAHFVIAGPRSPQLLCCYLCVTIAIAITIVRLHSRCSCCYCCVLIDIAIIGSCSGCTWREVCHGGHDLNRGHVGLVDAAKGLLLVTVCDCCVVVCVSQLSLPPLSDRISVVIMVMIATVVFLLHLEGGRHGDKHVGRGCVDIVDAAKGL